jgi:acetyltransferase-like isoleucine patch superfamily enzyme
MGIPVVQMLVVGLLPSFLKVAYYRSRGAKIGARAKIAPFAVLIADQIEIGDDCRIGLFSFVRAKRLRFGNRVTIGSMVAMDTGEIHLGHDATLMEQTVVGGMLTPRSKIHVGSRVKVFPYCFLNPTEPIMIEDDVGVGGSNYLFTHGSWQSALDGFPVGFGAITIRRGVWLPWRVFILPGVEIGEYCTIGAGAVINKSIPANSLAAGMPAKVISADGAYRKQLDGEARAAKVESILDEFVEYLRFSGHSVDIARGVGVLDLSVRRAGSGARDQVRFVPALGGLSRAGAGLTLTLAAIDPDQRQAMRNEGARWIDLESRLASGPLDFLTVELRNFLSRYGVRFGLESDPPFESEWR